jgi:ketosteroid isomerase-like protein
LGGQSLKKKLRPINTTSLILHPIRSNRRKIMKRLFLMFVVTFAFAGFALGECSDSDRKALEAFDRAWGDAGEKGDRNALMAILADDYTGLPAMQNKMQNIEAAIATAEYSRANPNMADKVSHDNYLISCTPGSAVITHRNIVTTKIGAGGKEETFWTRSRACLYGIGLEQRRQKSRHGLVRAQLRNRLQQRQQQEWKAIDQSRRHSR